MVCKQRSFFSLNVEGLCTNSHKLLKQMQYYENVIEIHLSSGQVSLLFNFYLPDLSVGQVGKNKCVILLGKVIIIIMCRGIVS